MAFLKFQAASPVALYVGAQEVVGIYYGAAQVWPLNPPLNAQAGTFALSGKAASLKVSRKLTAAYGAFSLNGQAATLSRTRKLMAEVGLFALTGQDVNMLAGTPFLAEAALFAFTGQAASLKVSRNIVAEAGIFALSGQPADLSVAGGDLSFNMTAGDYSSFLHGYSDGTALDAFGSIDVEPLPGTTLTVLSSAPGIFGVVGFPGDETATLAGKTIWVDGVVYPFDDDWAYDSGNDSTTASWAAAVPVFVVDQTYFIEIK